jgi:SAM-dependent methyltransferase
LHTKISEGFPVTDAVGCDRRIAGLPENARAVEPRAVAATDISQHSAPRRLNLGCGRDIRKGWVNLDCAKLPGVDVVHDLNCLPLPFATGEFTHICAKDVLEHLDYIPLLRELHRVLQVGGSLEVQVPHFTSVSNYIDPTHKRQFSIRTFEFFVAGSSFGRDYYFDFQFARVMQQRLTFLGGLLFWNKLVGPLVNSHPKLQQYYELTFLSRLFPAENVVIRLVK